MTKDEYIERELCISLRRSGESTRQMREELNNANKRLSEEMVRGANMDNSLADLAELAVDNTLEIELLKLNSEIGGDDNAI